MKPCAKNRKAIAWLTLDALEVQQAQQLRAHVETCEGCRRYLEAMSTAARTLQAAEIKGGVEASEAFHQRVTAAVIGQGGGWRMEDGKGQGALPRSGWGSLMDSLRGTALDWRVVLPVLGVVAMALVVVSLAARHRGAHASAPVASQGRPAPRSDGEFSPTIANYEFVANRSLDQLDELLTRQGSRNPSPDPIFTASRRVAANAAD